MSAFLIKYFILSNILFHGNYIMGYKDLYGLINLFITIFLILFWKEKIINTKEKNHSYLHRNNFNYFDSMVELSFYIL